MTTDDQDDRYMDMALGEFQTRKPKKFIGAVILAVVLALCVLVWRLMQTV